MKRSNWVRLIAVILVISMLAAPVSAVPNRSKDNANAKGMIDRIKDVTEDISDGLFDDSDDETSIEQNKAGKAKPGKPEKPSKPEKPEKPSKPEKPEKPSKPEKPEKPSKPEKPTEPVETEPTVPSEPEVTEPSEPVEDSPEYELNLVEGHANTANGHLLRGVTYTLSQVISQQSEPQVAPYALRSTKSSALALNAASAYAVQPMAEGDIQTMATVDITDGLVAHYDFESVESDTVTNNVTTNTTTTATLNNATVEETDHMGNAIQLSGGGLQLTNVVNAATSSFSVSLWYKADDNDHSNLVQAGTIDGSTGRTILLLNSDHKYFTYVTGDNAKVTTAAVDRSVWQHITFSYDKDTNKAYFFINGVADNADGVTLSGSPLSTADMIIGRHRQADDPFNGLIDEVRVYDKVLSAEEAAAVYNYGSTDPEEPSEPEQPVVDPADDSRDIPTSVLTATAGNSQSGEGPENTLDGNDDTLWHTSWDGSSRDTHWIQFQLSADYNVDGLRYRPRQGSGDGSDNGLITEYKIQVSDDGENFRDVVSGNWENDRDWKIAQFESENVKYVRLVVINAQSNSTTNLYASAAEIRLTGEVYEDPTPDPDPEQPETGYEVVRFPVTMFNYNNGTTETNDDSILRNLTHKAEIEAALEAGLDPAAKTLWEGLYFSGGSPAATSYTYNTSASSHDDLTWQQVMDGTYYADEACTNRVVVNEVIEGSGEYQQVEVSIGDLWTSFGGPEVDVKYATDYVYYNTNSYFGSTGYYSVYVSQDSNTWIYTWWLMENGNYARIGVYNLTDTASLYEQAGTITGYTLTAGGNPLSTLDGTDTSAQVGITLYTAGGGTTLTKNYAEWNWWSYVAGSNTHQNKFYAGLVQDELVNGEIKFNVVEPGIFTFDPDHPEITKDEVKDIYQNVGLPFVKNEKGYYTFDSDAHGTYFSDTTGDGKSDPGYGASDNYFDMYFDYQNTQGWADKSDPDSHLGYGDKSKNLWAPYNTNANDTGADAIDYHFGMRADIPFSMTSNGRIKSTDDNSEPITFTFQGDDDVWIFIDGHLVIDLGGIHNRLGATIDFANNTIEYFLPESNNNTAEFGAYGVENFEMVQKLYNDAAGEGALGQTRFDFSAEEEHEMSIFYLERGKGTSNCKIEFNLPMRDTVLITKDATKSWSEQADADDGENGDGTEDLTAKEQAAVDKLNFGFTLFKKTADETEFTAVTNTNFFVQNKDGEVIATSSTDGNGKFYLKNGQTAKFMTDIPKDGITYYVVEDAVPEGFLTPDYNYAGAATWGYEYIGEAILTDENGDYILDDEGNMTSGIVSGEVFNAADIGEHELPMDATENKSYEITVKGSVESIDSVEFICTNYLDADLPNPSALGYEDIIVIDYGLPVQIDPLANDLFRGDDIEIVAWGDESLTLNEVTDEHGNAIPYGTEGGTTWSGTQNFDFGNVTFNDVTYAETAHENENGEVTHYTYTRDSFEYELTKQLTEVEVISYIIKVTSTSKNDVTDVETTACRYSQANVYIVPATIMYYEENFSDMVTFTGSGWNSDATVADQENVSAYQEPGVAGTVTDSTYGSDVAYLSDDGDSNGTYRFGDTTNGAIRFTYTFTGTGSSIFARTSANTGYMQVKLYRGTEITDEALEDITYRDTYWKDDNGSELDAAGTLYNIPVYSTNENLDYDTYTVVCTIAKKGTITAGNDNGAGNEFYLDGIRVLRPLDIVIEQDDEGNLIQPIVYDELTTKALDAYAADGETNLDVVTLRQKLITDYDYLLPEEDENGEVVGEEEQNWPFAVLTDVEGEIVLASDYISIGPKNEVYLSKETSATNGQSVTFSLKYWQPEGLKLYMGMKAPFGHASVNVGHENIELNNAPDCYYDVTKNHASLEEKTDEDGNTYYVVTYTFEAAESIVSLTNIKVVGNYEFLILEQFDEEVDGSTGDGNG